MAIQELTSPAEFWDAYRLLSQLYEDLCEERFERELTTMRDQGYRAFGTYVDDELRAVAGINVVTNFANGKHVYLYDLVTDESYRSQGYGTELLRFIERWGDERGCSGIKLITGTDRNRAHEFYESQRGYRRTGYVFQNDIRASRSEE